MTADPTTSSRSKHRGGPPPGPVGGTHRDPALESAPPWAEADVAFLCDLRASGGTAWRLEAEARIQAQSGWRTAFIPAFVPEGGAPGRDGLSVDGPAAACLKEGVAFLLDPHRTMLRTRLLVLHGAETLFDGLLKGSAEPVPRILADRVVAVVGGSGRDRPPLRDVLRRDALLRSLFGPSLSWSATDAGVLEELRGAFPALGTEPEPWLPSTWLEPGAPFRPGRRLPVVGCIPVPGAAAAGPPAFPGALCRALVAEGAAAPAGWERIEAGEMDPVKFVASLDFLVHLQDGLPSGMPLHAVAQALVRGVPTILPPSLESLFGPGPLYLCATEMPGAVGRLQADPAAYRRTCLATARHARASIGPEIHRARLARLTGRTPGPLRGAARPRPKRRPVLFMSANEVGLGHLTRLLAVARRCPDGVAPVFACLGQGVRIVEQVGFPAEFIPTHSLAGCDPADWNAWLERQLDDMLDGLGVAAVVHDGSTLFDGLVRAVGRHRDCRLVWLRRAMWRATQANGPLLARQRFCDLVIEPGDIAQSMDGGITVGQRHLAHEVAPIRLLDPDELPGREAAAARLGLDPGRPAVLIQLGAGTNRDVVGMIGAVLEALAAHPEIQPVIAEWATAPPAPDLWPGVKRLRGFPFGRWFNAFDFTVSAAGYNAFHEILDFGLPALFLPNGHPSMDDQAGRAAFAQAQGCAFHLAEADRVALPTLVGALLEPKVRRLMRDNCRRLALPNGAGQAASAIASLVSRGISG